MRPRAGERAVRDPDSGRPALTETRQTGGVGVAIRVEGQLGTLTQQTGARIWRIGNNELNIAVIVGKY